MMLLIVISDLLCLLFEKGQANQGAVQNFLNLLCLRLKKVTKRHLVVEFYFAVKAKLFIPTTKDELFATYRISALKHFSEVYGV